MVRILKLRLTHAPLHLHTFFLGTLPYGIVKREINSMDDCFDEMQEPLFGFRHSIHIRTVSSYCPLSTLKNQFKLVYGPFGQSNMHCTFNF